MTVTTAVLLMAYGTPSSTADIERYYTDIRRGHAPSTEQLAALTARYEAIGGTSPLAARTEAQRAALQSALDGERPGSYMVVLGLKHSPPAIETAVDSIAAQGFRRVVGLVLAAHYSALSVGQYFDRLREAAAPHDIDVRTIDSWATEPAFVQFLATQVRAELATMPSATRTVFTAHSLPARVADGDPYPAQLRATAVRVAERSGLHDQQWSIAWQSAGRTPEPWLGPDILQVIDEIDGPGVLVCAAGFVSDHLEVLYDLDIEAARRAAQRGLAFARTKCVNDDATVMAALARRVIDADAH